MKVKLTQLAYIFVILGLLLQACSTARQVETTLPPVESTLEDPSHGSPTDFPIVLPESTVYSVPVVSTDIPTAIDVPAVDPTDTPAPIVHISRPGNPTYIKTQVIGECNTGFNFISGSYKAGKACDSWAINLLERPVSADLTIFYPYIDIISAQLGKDSTWYYTKLEIYSSSSPTDEQNYTYFFEFDLDFDGRGDVLFAVENLPVDATDWTVSGVRSWQDSNKDVGGTTPVRADETYTGDGYETLIFDEGLGSDPDLLWVRRSPSDPEKIEFAYKPALINSKPAFMWWAGALRGSFDPARFDLVDSLEEEARYALDNTCGWSFGADARNLIKHCYIPPEPTAKPSSGGNSSGCIKPPSPDSSDSNWKWSEAKCKWEYFN